MHQPVFHRGRLGAPAPAAALLLALCLLAVGAQAADTPRYVVGDILVLTDANQHVYQQIVGGVQGTAYYTLYDVEQNAGRWEIPSFWHHDFTIDGQNLVENLHARRTGHVDPVRVIITDYTITGGDQCYGGLSLSEVRHGAMYPVEPDPGVPSGYPNVYIVGDILGNVSDPNRGSVVSSVYEQNGVRWFRVYFDAVRSGDRWILDKFYNDDMAFTWGHLDQNDMRRVAHADPHTVIINDTTTNTGEMGWYRLSLAEYLAGKGYDWMGAWHFNTGDILSNGTATRYIVGSANRSDSGPSHYTLYEVVRGADGWTIPAYVDAGIPIEAPLGVQLDGTGFDLVDHTDPHFAVVTDPSVENGVIYDGLSLGEILEGTPGYPPESPEPIGGDTGYFMVSTMPAGADVYLEDISGTRTLEGNTSTGPLNVTVYLTGTPVRAVVATLPGYRDAVYNVTQYPAKGETLPVTLTLEPRPTPLPTDAPGPYRLHIVPGRVQAEDYDFYIFGGEGVTYHDTTPGNSGGAYRHDDVDIEAANGITDVGWIRNGEYLTYTVDVATTGDYAVAARVATPNPGCWIRFSVDGQPGTALSLPRTGSFDMYTTATRIYYTSSPTYPITATMTPVPSATGFPPSEHPLRLTAGSHVLKLEFSGDGQNLDWFELTPYVEPTPVVPEPYRPLAIPGTIQAEDYNLGGEGAAYHDTTAANEGGAYRHDGVDIETGNGITNVGWIRSGEWMTYTANVTTAGTYTMTARVASPNTGRAMALIVDQSFLTSIEVPNTGSFATFRTVDVPVTLAAGQHTIKLSFVGDGQNIDWIAFAAPIPTPEPYVNVTLPAMIQAEDYDLGGEGIAYHDTTAGNSGGAYRADGVDVAVLPGGGNAVVGIEDGEYLTYTIGGVSQTPELPALVLYLGSDRDGGSVELEVNGRVAGIVSVPNTGSPSAFTAVQTQVQAAKGTLRLRFHGSGMGMDRIESPVFTAWADAYAEPNFTADRTNGTAPLTVRFTDTSSEWAYEWHWDFGDGSGSTEKNPVHTFSTPGVYPVSLTVKESDRWLGGTILNIWNDPSHKKTAQVTVSGPGPTPGHVLPDRIEAEDYDTGSEGVTYHDTTPQNEGGAYRTDGVDIEAANGITNVGWIRDGEWLAYTAAVQAAGTYTVTASVASPYSGRTIVLLVDDAPIATIAVPNTGSFARFATVTAPLPVSLPAGIHTLKLAFAGNGQNLDWFAIGCNCPAPPTSPVPSGGASFTAAPATAPYGGAVKFAVTPAAGKTVRAAWWSFDAPAHLNTWNSRAVNPTFYYPARGTYSPLVRLTYTDGSTETVQRTNYVRAT